MIVLNIVLMVAVVTALVSLLAWAIVSDRRSYRTAGGEISPAQAPLHRDLTMPHELRRGRQVAGRSRAPQSRRRVPSSSPA